MRNRWARIAIYVLGAWVSQERLAEHWVVGPVFGCVVVLWDSPGFAALPRRAHLAFIAASTLIYALVFQIADAAWGLEPEALEWVIGSVPAGVAVGSFLLPWAHRRLIGGEGLSVVRTALVLLGSFYAVTWIGGILDRLGLGGGFNYFSLTVYLWQGLYLRLLLKRARL